MTKNKTTNIRKYRRKVHWNIGLIIFGVIFIYLTVTILMYLLSPKVSIYEVREGSILRDTAYTGFVVREEEVINAKKSGYINYLTPEGNKVGAKTKVYALSDEKLKFENIQEDTETLSTEEQEILMIKTQSFSDNYKDGQFSDVYTLKDDITSVLESKTSQNRQAQLSDMKEELGDTLKIYKAKNDGIAIYSTDGYESITIDKITEDILNKKKYEVSDISDNSKITKGSPVYKLITSDKWSIVINLANDTVNELKDTKSIKVRFLKDNLTAKASFFIEKKNNLNLGVLSFDSSMIRYAKERYLDIELILEDESGLKIPKSSVIQKEFYLVPEEYLTQGGNSNDTGVLLKTGDNNVSFTPVSIYYRDYAEEMVYLDPLVFDQNIIIVKPDSTETYQLGKTKKLKGVYNINKGYALFKQIQILCESDEYYIVEEGNSYGLSNYDHIALDGSSLDENDVVF